MKGTAGRLHIVERNCRKALRHFFGDALEGRGGAAGHCLEDSGVGLWRAVVVGRFDVDAGVARGKAVVRECVGGGVSF